MSVLPKAVYKFTATPFKIPKAFFTELRTNNYKICMETEKTLNSQSNLEKEEQSWRTQPSWLQNTLQSYSHQDSMVLAQRQKYRSMEQESPEINPCTYGHLIFNKGGKNIQWRKDNLFNKWCWENCIASCKRMKLEYFLTTYTNINSKWIEDINVRPETIKLLKENIGSTFWHFINQSKIFFDPSPRVMEIKIKINKWDLIKLISLCTAMETTDKMKR